MKRTAFLKCLVCMGLCLVAIQSQARRHTYDNGDKYNGKWEQDAPQGEGTMTYANHDVYTGNWEKGKKEGKGTMTYANGDV
ncbi:MAG: hypothetical protein IJL64_00155, partial [Bacteroidales bacterium]|nr:hypothetical protein [Bacteroidales bacterium]